MKSDVEQIVPKLFPRRRNTPQGGRRREAHHQSDSHLRRLNCHHQPHCHHHHQAIHQHFNSQNKQYDEDALDYRAENEEKTSRTDTPFSS